MQTEPRKRMSVVTDQNSNAAARSAVESELYQSTKHLRVITDADLALLSKV